MMIILGDIGRRLQGAWGNVASHLRGDDLFGPFMSAVNTQTLSNSRAAYRVGPETTAKILADCAPLHEDANYRQAGQRLEAVAAALDQFDRRL